ncbi:MAG: class I SAM-dependent methyltransferase [Pseudomonadota bacterium]
MNVVSPDPQLKMRHWLHVPCDWRRPGVEGAYEIYWNDALGYGEIRPRPSSEEVSAFYDVESYYTHDAPPSRGKAGASFADRVLGHLAWRADQGEEPDRAWWAATLGASKLRILEIGCGNGSNLSIFRDLGHEAVGVEPDPAARAVAAAAGHETHPGTGEDLPRALGARAFDVVVFMHVLEHCVDPALAIRNARAHLAEGGRIVAEVPNNACRGAAFYGAVWHWLDAPRHLNFFTERSLYAVFEGEDVQIADVCYRGYARQFNRGWLDTQASIAARMGLSRSARDGWWGAAAYLLATFWRKRAEKYDSVRVVARI